MNGKVGRACVYANESSKRCLMTVASDEDAGRGGGTRAERGSLIKYRWGRRGAGRTGQGGARGGPASFRRAPRCQQHVERAGHGRENR